MIPLPPWVRPTIAATALLSAFSAGWYVESLRWDSANAERLEAAEKARAKQEAKANQSAAGFEADRAQIDTDRRTGETTIRTIYAEKVVPADCALDVGARGVLSEAIQRANADSAVASKPVPDTP